MNYTSRPFDPKKDYPAMRKLLQAAYAINGPLVYATVGDLDWWRAERDDPRDWSFLRLWWDERGELGGFAWQGGNQVDLFSHPTRRRVEADMLAWSEQQQREKLAGSNGQRAWRAWALTSDSSRQTLLGRNGYQRASDSFAFFNYPLEGEVPPTVLPDGFKIRPVAGKEEYKARVELHRQAFDPSRFTAAKYRAVRSQPTYRPDLDLVVAAPDGTLAAFAILWFDEANRIGEFEPVGCAPQFRRQGLTRALLLEGLRRLRRLGGRFGHVYCDASEEPAMKLYASVGFREVDRVMAWEKEL
ncbi:predicted acetyltransferase [Longilinea arvoryzae]|uniref:Predicted acetyltransferase n=1 Tax=Longilinea arvoryzae TaxID=360412 RepID=A0A0K8MXD4_9CHLR|nr:GNAT family N-acetyltransferase [Longilinea arvoryzae]GAP15918.1 predicted acetyltransferase [Longilinea arvoryzae]